MAIAYVGRAGSNHGNTNGATETVTTTASIAAGHLIVVSVSGANVGDTSNLTSVTDSAGNTYVSGGFTCDPGQNTLTAVWYAANCLALASGSTVTVTFHAALLSSGESWQIAVDDISGAATSTVTDGTTARNSQTGATWDTRTGGTTDLTTTNANDLLWVAAGVNQGAPLALTNANSLPSSGWTSQAAISGGAGNNNQLVTAYQVVSSTGTYRGGGTATAGNNGTSAVIVAFKAAGGGGSTVNGTATEVANAALTETARIQAPGTLASNAALSETARILASATEQSNAAITEAARIVAGAISMAANAVLSAGSIVPGSASMTANAGMSASAQVLAAASLVASSALTQAGVTLGTDTFAGRTVASGWGNGSDGTAWVADGTTDFSVSAGEGRITYNAGANYFPRYGTGTAIDQEQLCRFTPGGANDTIGFILRQVNGSNLYFARVVSGVLTLSKKAAGVSSNLVTTAYPLTGGQAYWMRARIQGTSLAVKIWLDGAGEPSAWTLATTDSDVSAAGVYGLSVSNMTSGQTLLVDSYSIRDPSANGAQIVTGANIAASAALAQSAAQLLSSATLAANAALSLATISVPGTVTLTDALAATVTLADALAATVTLSDALAATVTLSDAPAEAA